ncbi:MAG: 23S rRNA (pseudouridine(1915)-N(3))-methyltransferase RlmH, partial [Clostridiaceae bacterium]|nr:23S rRNA (pseudouridine(1915)-N(3))-methyltransferase RlmH [Clostridiaceae bacterium]
INIIEVPDLKIPENASEKQIAELLIKEGEGIFRCVKNNAYVIALCVEAKQMSSEEFAKTLKTLMDNSVSDIVFIIGGSMGLSEEVKKRANLKLGISQMTLPHQMARLVLIEQIYRAFKILNNETYHK